MAILRGVEIALPFLAKRANSHITIGVSTITKNGFSACHISGATESVCTKSRANTLSDCPFWWNDNQKKIAIPSTANRAYKRCLISVAICFFSSAVYSCAAEDAFFAGCGNIFFVPRKMNNDSSIAATDAINE